MGGGSGRRSGAGRLVHDGRWRAEHEGPPARTRFPPLFLHRHAAKPRPATTEIAVLERTTRPRVSTSGSYEYSGGGDFMLKRVMTVLWVLALVAGCVVGTNAVWAAGAPKAYVGLFKDDAVAVIDTAQNKWIGTISVPKGPHGVVVTPGGRKIYVSGDGASTVSVIDTANDRVVASIDVGATPHGLAVSGDGRRVLVMGWGSNRVLVIDTATDPVIGEVPVSQPHNSTLSPDRRTRWVASQQQRATALPRLEL